jgi:hypothetical protein
MRRRLPRDFQERDKSKHESSSVNPFGGQIPGFIEAKQSTRETPGVEPTFFVSSSPLQNICDRAHPIHGFPAVRDAKEKGSFGELCRQYDLLAEKNHVEPA